MPPRNRSRDSDKHANSKSFMNGSVQTKQQSTIKSSPNLKSRKKNIERTLRDQKKPKKPAIKSLTQLNQFMSKLTQKLQSFEKQSTLSSLKTTNIKIAQIYPFAKGSETYMEKNSSTSNLLEKIKVQELTNTSSGQKLQIKNNLQEIVNYSIQYQHLFDKALSKPHCIKKISINKRRKPRNILKQDNNLWEELKCYKKQQNEKWRTINLQLMKYLSKEKLGQSLIERNKIEQKLMKQGRANLIWLQIQQKMSQKDYQISQLICTNHTCSLKVNQLQVKSVDSNEMNRQDESIKQLFLKNCKIGKISQVSSTSDLLCQSGVSSSFQCANMNPFDLIQETNQIYENVQLILAWLIDQFVVQLAGKLDFNSLGKLQNQNRNDPPLKNQAKQQDYYAMFLARINQICQDCLQLDKVLVNQEYESPIIIDALTQFTKNNPELSSSQIQQKLRHLICTRQIDISQLIKPFQKQSMQLQRIMLVSQIESLLWETLILEETDNMRKFKLS